MATTEAKPAPPSKEPSPSKPDVVMAPHAPSSTVVAKDAPAVPAPQASNLGSATTKDTLRSTKGSHRSGRKPSYQKKKMIVLSSIQKKQVDAVFEKLFGYSWGTEPSPDISSHDSSHILLTKIFGSKKAAKVLFSVQRQRRTKESTTVKIVQKSSLPPKTAPKNQTPKASTLASQATRTAGVAAAAAFPSDPTPKPSQQPPSVASGVDSLLHQMQDKKKTSTIMRTAMDWESFKEQSGTLGEKLEQHAESKGAYLKRQDFLNRVDNRKFEQERDDRERNRAKNN
mmetsp:Transcript_7860/g.21921  ORF Transcript_7860/g.21921 Transcript_7860/m.21921 type:complete len:284 (+) Transcript_7860:59-910(+)